MIEILLITLVLTESCRHLCLPQTTAPPAGQSEEHLHSAKEESVRGHSVCKMKKYTPVLDLTG